MVRTNNTKRIRLAVHTMDKSKTRDEGTGRTHSESRYKGGLYCLRHIFWLLRRGPNLEYGTNAAIAGGFR